MVLERQRFGRLTGVRSETCKDREQQGFTQGNPDPSAASEAFLATRPWPLSSPHWPAHSRDVSPGMFCPALLSFWMLLRCSHWRQMFHLDISVPFSLPGKSKSLLRVAVPGSLAVHAIGKCITPSVPELSDLVLHILFSKMPSFITSRAELCVHLLASLSNTGMHRHWLWGQGKVLRLWPLWVHSHQRLQRRFRGLGRLGTAGDRGFGAPRCCCAGKKIDVICFGKRF